MIENPCEHALRFARHMCSLCFVKVLLQVLIHRHSEPRADKEECEAERRRFCWRRMAARHLLSGASLPRWCCALSSYPMSPTPASREHKEQSWNGNRSGGKQRKPDSLLKEKTRWSKATRTRQFAEGNGVEQKNSNPTVCCPEDETQAATPDMLLALPRSMHEVRGTWRTRVGGMKKRSYRRQRLQRTASPSTSG